MEPHYEEKAKKARSVAHGVLHIESMIGSLPPKEGRLLYMGCVDPHLIYGCEVALDTSEYHFRPIKQVQGSFIRRLLGLSKTATSVAMYTETGLAPIAYRRMELALRYLAYALQRPEGTLVHAAVNDSIALHETKQKGWFSDLLKVLERNLPTNVRPIPSISEMRDAVCMKEFSDQVRRSVKIWVEDELSDKYRKTYLISLRKEPQEGGKYKYQTMGRTSGTLNTPRHSQRFRP